LNRGAAAYWMPRSSRGMTTEFGATAQTNFQDAILPLFCPTEQADISLFPNSKKPNDLCMIATVHGVVFALFVLTAPRLPLR
jgi:hypothetical protein